MRHLTDDERRARLARRHRLAAAHRAADAVEATRAVVCLHATDPATVFLSAHARVDGMTVADLERALYVDRTLVKHLAMRRTLFVFPREHVAIAQAAASTRVAATERARLSRFVQEGGLHEDGGRWLAAASKAVLKVLERGELLTFPELRTRIPLLEGSIAYAPDRKWGGALPVGSRVLTVLSAEGKIVRGVNRGGWHVSRPEWAAMPRWLGAPLEIPSAAAATAALVGHWLRAFGPGTENDLKWWLGSTLTAVRRALGDLEAVEVALDGGGTGYVLPDDLGETKPPAPWVALLPPLDPTPMGWADRAWYLGAHKPHVFDRNGNVGPTVWCDGRIVGGWRQQTDGTIELQLLEDVSRSRRRLIDEEARRLGVWMKGLAVKPRFPSPLSKR